MFTWLFSIFVDDDDVSELMIFRLLNHFFDVDDFSSTKLAIGNCVEKFFHEFDRSLIRKVKNFN